MDIILILIFVPLIFLTGFVLGLRDGARVEAAIHNLETHFLTLRARIESAVDEVKKS